jgi:hypothetical protein
MKKSIVWMCCILLILACSKNDENYPPGPIPRSPVSNLKAKFYPVSIVGRDTIIYYPFNSIELNGGDSYDLDGYIDSYRWSFIGGPVNINILNWSSKVLSYVLTEPGEYIFSLMVTDNDGLFSVDTIKVTLGNPECTGPEQEFIFYSAKWLEDDWNMGIFYSTSLSGLLPRQVKVKRIYIREAGDEEWQELTINGEWEDDKYLCFARNWGITIISPYPENLGKSFDYRIVYCN